MIHAEYFHVKDTISLKLTGHSSTAPKGEDVFCAGATMLAYTLAQCVKSMKRRMKRRPVIKLEEGDIIISCRPKRRYRGAVRAMYWVITTGLILEAANFPEYITFKDITPRG